jgi:hypothetical protein
MLDEARHASSASRNNAAVVASIHSAINSIDALSVFYFGRRHKGSHEASLDGIKSAFDSKEFAEMSRQFSGLMALKNEAEYQPNLMQLDDAADAVKRASRILAKIRSKLPTTPSSPS